MERKQASEYPQELLDLFHEYQHGDIDRRSFLDHEHPAHGSRRAAPAPMTRREGRS